MIPYIDKKELENWINNKTEQSLLNLDLMGFVTEVMNGVKTNNTAIISEIMMPDKYPKVSKDKKEEIMFNNAATLFNTQNIGQAFLHYLIFDYRISEENSINKIMVAVDDRIKQMFKIRELKSELNAELKTSEINQKKSKV